VTSVEKRLRASEYRIEYVTGSEYRIDYVA